MNSRRKRTEQPKIKMLVQYKSLLSGLCGWVVAAGTSCAALLLEDHFDYPDGNLGATGIGDTVWTSGDSPSAAIRVSNAAALDYAGLANARGSGVVFSGTTFKKRSAPFPAQSNGTVYCSFLLNVQVPAGGTKLFLWLHNAGGGTSSPGLGLFLNGYELGLAKYTSSPMASTNIGSGTHLIVTRYTFQPGNDRVDLWIDPTSLGDNNNVPSPTLSAGTNSSSDISSLSYIVLNHGISQTLWLDEVRVGTSWADVTPATVVQPTPEPRFTDVFHTTDGLVLEGTNGPVGGLYVVLATTNLALPLTHWRPVATNMFGPHGQFTITNPILPGVPQQFYQLFVGTNVPMAPFINTHPAAQTVGVGDTAVFNVNAVGTPPLRYQWYFNSVPMLGQTNATLTLTNAQLTETGDYTVVVSNPFGVATSAVATLTVTIVPPSIIAQPTNQTVGIGQSATFYVIATGTPPLSYQWFFNNMPLEDQTNTTLLLEAAQPENAGNYHVVVTNIAGAVTSAVAVLTVTGPTPPLITRQPQDRVAVVGQTVSFDAAATGTPPLRYQWFFSTNATVTMLLDKTNAVLVLPNVQTDDAGGYFVVVTNDYGAATSVIATLTVNPQPQGGVVQQTIQAEEGVFIGTVETDHSGWTGSGYVNTENATGSYIEIEFGVQQAGTETLYVRYAHGKTDDRSAELRVNGAVVNSSVAFPQTGSWTSWQVVSNQIPVQAGRNTVRLTALTSAGLANIDCFQVTGAPQFRLKVTVQGRGTVLLEPTNAFAYYNPGTVVTLSAVPGTNAEFTAWSGALTGTNNPVTLVIDTNKAVTAQFVSVFPSTIYVSPTGNDLNPGTIDAPLYSLSVAVAAAEPGDTIYMRGGSYFYAATVVLDKAGMSNNPIRILAYLDEKPVLNYSNWRPANEDERAAARGIKVTTNAAWWIIKGLEICYAPDNGVKCEGSHIVFDQCVFHHNGDSGLQIGLNKDTFSTNPNPDHWAAYNLVINCDSYRNADPATGYENADGFACKLYAGKGNRFYGCRAWENCDDGWDCYQTEHPIVIENCWTWHNGDPSLWGFSSFSGDGNGFKLGGDNTYCPIFLTNCIALDLKWGTTVGFAYNNNTAPITLVNCAALNCGRPYKFEQNGNVFINCLDWNSTRPAPVDITGTSTQINNSWNLGITVRASDFVSVSAADAAAPREPDGGLPNNGFARPAPGSQLIDRGVDVGLPYNGTAPDLGAREHIEP